MTPTGHAIINVLINGKKARLVIDSAAGRSVIHSGRVNSFGIKKMTVVKRIEARGLGTSNHAVEQLQPPVMYIGKAIINNMPLISVDLTHVMEAGGKRGFDGLLGSDFLKRHGAVIDFEKRQLSFNSCGI